MSGVVEWVSDPYNLQFLTSSLLAVCALAVSVWAAYSSRKANREAAEAQSKLARIEEQREADRLTRALQAALRAKLLPDRNGSHRLCVSNRGQSEARDIRIIVDGRPLGEHLAFHSGMRIPEVMEPGSEISCHVATFDSNPPFEIEILWEDDSGVPGRYRATLTP